MQLKAYYPDNATTLTTKEFLSYTQGAWIGAALEPISEYYNSKLSLPTLLAEYGVEVDPGAKEAQINCTFSEHGSHDNHKSARFYNYDRKTDTKSERVFCFKCEKVTSAFWYAYKQKKDFEQMKLKDLFIWIEARFRIPFPKHILLEFDLESHYTFGSSSSTNRTLSLFAQARNLHAYRSDWDIFIPALQGLISQSSNQSALPLKQVKEINV